MNIDCNKQLLASIIETILFVATKIFHLEEIKNLLIQTTQVILSPCCNFELTMKEHFSTAPGNAQYTSQGDIVFLIKSQMQKKHVW